MALAVALDRGALLKIAGGSYAGGPGDGAIKPNIGADYAPTGMWDGLLGKKIPINGDPAYAKQLIQESGKPMPTIVYSYQKSPDADKGAAAIKLSLGKAGINVTLNPIPAGQYYGTVFNKDRATALMQSGWGPDWPNASTVIPPLFTPAGGFDLSYVDDAAFNKQVATAHGGDGPYQAVPALAGPRQGGLQERLAHPDPVREVPGASPAPRSTRHPATTPPCTSGRRTVPGPTPTCTSASRSVRSDRCGSRGDFPSGSRTGARPGANLSGRSLVGTYIVRRLIAMVLMLIALSMVVFLLFAALPTEPGASHLRQGLHARHHRRQRAPARPGQAASPFST